MMSGQPGVSLERLRLRAGVMRAVRGFVEARAMLEVDVSREGSADPQASAQAMWRLLAAGSGPVYHLGKAWRDGEQDRRRHPEFTRLEWWRPGSSLEGLMTEAAELVATVLQADFPIVDLSYREAFQRRLELDPHALSARELKAEAAQLGLRPALGEDRLAWLDLLFSHFVEPTLGFDGPIFLSGLLAERPGLARVAPDGQGVSVACCFDLYINGLKVAGGQESVPPEGQPCAGAALGIDRLLMVMTDQVRIDRVLALP